MAKSELINSVREAGIVGCGGAGFPTHVKIDADCEVVIANGAECEPMLYKDKEIMRLYPGLVLEGLKLVIKQTSASRGG